MGLCGRSHHVVGSSSPVRCVCVQFKEISQAYEVLSDVEKREIYDQYGEEALKEGAGGGMHDPFDLFSSFFGTGGHPFGGSFGRECPALFGRGVNAHQDQEHTPSSGTHKEHAASLGFWKTALT